MKKLLSLAIGLGLVFAVAGVASANNPSYFADGDPATGILDSRHNMGNWGVHWTANNADSNGGTSEVCVFCHTPHHGASANHQPLWTKAVTAGSSYTSYGTTLAGTSVYGSACTVSLACLSCHDGAGAVDNLINAPGKGNGSAGNNTTATNFDWTFTEDGNTINDFLSSTRLNLGTDLSDDHPTCVPYTAGVASLRATNTVISTIVMTNSVLSSGSANSSSSRTDTRNRWGVQGTINLGASIADLLRGGQVECSSCHDPHFSNKSWDEVNATWGGSHDSDGLFLRRVGGNSLSGVCRTCHDK
jgi:hypothetical protein